MKSESINMNIVIDGKEILWETKNVIKKNYICLIRFVACYLIN